MRPAKRTGVLLRVLVATFVGVMVSAAAVAQDVTPPTVMEVKALDGMGGEAALPATLDFAPASIVVTFSEDIDPATVSLDAFRLVRSGGDGSFVEGNEVVVVPDSVGPTGPGVVTMTLGSATMPDDKYEVRVAGTIVPEAGLVGHWTFDETGGTTAHDSSGNGNDATLVGGPTWTADGKLGGALQTDGRGEYVGVPADASLEPASAISLALWVCAMDAFPETWADVMRKSGSPTDGYLLRWSHSDARLQFRADRAANPSFALADTQFNYSYLGAWHHLAATYDQASGTARLYVDGVQKASLSGI